MEVVGWTDFLPLVRFVQTFLSSRVVTDLFLRSVSVLPGTLRGKGFGGWGPRRLEGPG